MFPPNKKKQLVITLTSGDDLEGIKNHCNKEPQINLS